MSPKHTTHILKGCVLLLVNFNVWIVKCQDNIPPEFNTCPSDIFNNTFPTAFLGISVSISWEEPTYDDEGGTVQLHKTHSTGDLFIVGEQTLVIYTLTDTAGNFATCAFVVTLLPSESSPLVDSVPPTVIKCPGNVTGTIEPGQTGVQVSWIEPIALDASEPPAVTVVRSSNPGDFFEVGKTDVSYTFTDSSSNSATCYFTVVVQLRVCTPNPCNGGICSDLGGHAVCDCSGTTFVGAECDVPIQIQFALQTATGVEGAGQLAVQVCLDPALPRTFDIPFGLAPTTTVAGNLVVPTSGIINEQTACTDVTFHIVDDQLIESSETFSVLISSASVGIEIDPNQNTLYITIIDDDSVCTPNPCNGGICSYQSGHAVCDCSGTTFVGVQCNVPIQIQFALQNTTGVEGAGQLAVQVCLDPALPRTFDIPFGLATTTAVAGDQVVPTSGIISAQMACNDVTIQIVDDQLVEFPETFSAFILSASVGIVIDPNQNTLSIIIIDDDDPVIRFSTSSITVPENIGATSVDVCFTNVQSFTSNVDFTLVTNPISASASASDYVVQATGTILAGDPCTTVTISITDDRVQEPSEQFVVTLTSVITGNAIINSSFNTFTVTVSGSNTTPVITCPDPVVVTSLANNVGNIAIWDPPTCVDAEDGTVTTSVCVPASAASLHGVGVNTVTCTCTDSGGLSDECTFPVTVEDINECNSTSCDNTTTNCVNANGGFTCECRTGHVKDPVNPRTCISSENGPVVTMCPTSMNYVTCGSEYEVTWITPEVRGASDSNLVTKSSHSPGDLFSLGDTEVIYTFEDQFGNVALCSFQVSVRKQTENCGITSYTPYVVAAVCLLCGLLLTGILMVLCRKVCTKANKNNSHNLQNQDIHTSVVGGSGQTELPRPTKSIELETLYHRYDEPPTNSTWQMIMSHQKSGDVENQYEQVA